MNIDYLNSIAVEKGIKAFIERSLNLKLSNAKFELITFTKQTVAEDYLNSASNSVGGVGNMLYFGDLYVSIKRNSSEPVTNLEIIKDNEVLLFLNDTPLTPAHFIDNYQFRDILFNDIKVTNSEANISYYFIGFSFKIRG